MIYEKMVSSWDNLQISDWLDLLHDDYEFVMHSTGKVSNMKNMDPDIEMKCACRSVPWLKKLPYADDTHSKTDDACYAGRG